MSDHEPSDCERMLDELQDVLRGEASPEAAAAVRRHLDVCTPCLRHAAFEERFLSLLRSCAGQRIPADVRERLLAAIRAGGH
jgi:anti-sigma factor (TIGR02949 family)